MVNFFPPPNTDYSEPPRLIPKIPFSFFAEFWVRVTSGARGSVSVGFWGARQLSPFCLGGGVWPQGLYRPPPPPPPKSKTRPPAEGVFVVAPPPAPSAYVPSFVAPALHHPSFAGVLLLQSAATRPWECDSPRHVPAPDAPVAVLLWAAGVGAYGRRFPAHVRGAH